MRHAGTVLAIFIAIAALGCEKQKADEAPPEGWYTEEGWPAECFFPKNYDALGFGDRKLARAAILTEMMRQWSGERSSEIRFESDDVIWMETVMLGEPELIEAVSQRNAAFCKEYMSALPEERSVSAWKAWFESEPDRLTEGDCPNAPLVDTVFQYLNVTDGWQFKWGVCEGDVITVRGSTMDKYRLEARGPWMDVEGNGERAVAEEYPCNMEGCTIGQLVMRFTDVNGVESVYPIGAEKRWVSPGHGFIEVRVNDITLGDNAFREARGVIDHTSISYIGGTE